MKQTFSFDSYVVLDAPHLGICHFCAAPANKIVSRKETNSKIIFRDITCPSCAKFAQVNNVEPKFQKYERSQM